MPAMTRSARIAKVEEALAALPAALKAAQDAEKKRDARADDDAHILALWETVEMLGATVHRQSRILAGKSRGG